MATQASAHRQGEDLASGAVDLSELFREPQQERSRKTLARLVDATHSLLEEEGPAALTVTGVARAAGTSVGSFYARFDGKEELIRYVGESALAHALEEWSEALAACRGPDSSGAPDDLAPGLASLVDHLVRALQSGPAARVESMDGLQDPAPTRLERFRRQLVQDLEQLLETAQSTDHARWLAARGLVAMARSVAEEVSRQKGEAAPDELAGEVSTMLELYLAARRGDPGRQTPEETAPDEPASEKPEPHEAKADETERDEAAPHETTPDEAQPHETGAEESEPVEPDEGSPADPVDPFDVWG